MDCGDIDPERIIQIIIAGWVIFSWIFRAMRRFLVRQPQGDQQEQEHPSPREHPQPAPSRNAYYDPETGQWFVVDEDAQDEWDEDDWEEEEDWEEPTPEQHPVELDVTSAAPSQLPFPTPSAEELSHREALALEARLLEAQQNAQAARDASNLRAASWGKSTEQPHKAFAITPTLLRDGIVLDSVLHRRGR